MVSYRDVDRIANERFMTYFMLPLFGVLFLVMIGIGVGVLTGVVAVDGSRTWGWAFLAVPVPPIIWVAWSARLHRKCLT